MHELFRGWRRNTGGVTLLLSLGLLGMWYRSQVVEDYAEIAYVSIISQHGSVSCSCNPFIARKPYWESHPLSPSTPGIGNHFRFHVKYLDLVLILTLLSAYLILWKPRSTPAHECGE